MKKIFNQRKLNAGQLILDSLRPALQHLDCLLEQAIAAAQAVYEPEAATDPHRGLYITQDQVARLLSCKPGDPLLWLEENRSGNSLADSISPDSRLALLQQTFNLSPFDIDLILIALAPEIDLRYERLYAYLQDDVTRKRPTVDLALNLLCPDAVVKLERRAHFFAPSAPLMKHGLLHLTADPHQVQPPFLSYYLKLDEQISRFLLGHSGLDSRLATACELIEPSIQLDSLTLTPEIKQGLRSLARQTRETQQPLRLYFQGLQGLGQRPTAEALAAEIGRLLLCVNLIQVLETNTDFAQLLQLLWREAWFQNAILYLDGLDALGSQANAIPYRQLLAALSQGTSITILAGVQPWLVDGGAPMGIIVVPFTTPDFARRRTCWQTNLKAAGIAIASTDLDALADRFCLTSDQIASAITTACNTARWRAACSPAPEANRKGEEGEQGIGEAVPNPKSQTAAQEFREGGHNPVRPAKRRRQAPAQNPKLIDLFAAARAQSGPALAALARKIEPKFRWNDIVLAPERLAQLWEICNQVKYRHVVYGEWGFDDKLSLGKGVNALFSGPPGTGKTMAAEIIASELQLDLYKIDLSQVVSKYIGETEKNLDRIFTAAENANIILLFDEADALFGKRSEVKDAHDRYANLEIAYLLQKMEEYEGITILTSNLRQNLDEAFTRRIRFIVEFPFPEPEYRLQIWQGIWPKKTPLAAELDLKLLAQKFKLAGGNIRNIALAAAFLAAEEGHCVSMKHLLQATKREFQKMGRLIGEKEFLQFE